MASEPEPGKGPGWDDTVVAALTAVGIDAATVAHHPSSTIEPPRRHDSAGARAVAALRAEVTGPGGPGAIDLGETLGEGGMGLVRVGRQRRMGRTVAVKSLKPEALSQSDTTLELLREAWITGSLEHPNVVPVYDITLDETGVPSVILKRIEGDDWGSLMHDADAVRERLGEEDLLVWNLRVLTQVCQAVRFAHSRHIVHRDLKPENVRVGPFGEVYLLDWGIAVCLVDDGSGRFALARDAHGLAGTPAYMAPEMLDETPVRLGIRTDVYLLGSILFEIVSGDAPHTGSTWHALLSSVLLSRPRWPDDVAPELRAIGERAMAPHPEERFEDVDAFRLEIEAFLRHREALHLAERASRRHAELRGVATGGDGSLDQREVAYRLFNECRFGFQSALEGWPDNARLREELDAAIATMVRYELDEGHPLAARSLLADMSAVSDALEAEVSELADAQAEERALLEELRADADLDTGRRTRAFLSLLIASIWVAIPAVTYVRVAVFGVPTSPMFALAAAMVMLVIMAALGLWARESIMKTRINRQVAAAATLGVSSMLVTHLATLLRGDSIWQPLYICQPVWAGIVFTLAFSVDLRLLIPGFGYLASFLVLAAFGTEHVLLTTAFGHASLLITALALWARPSEDLRALRRRSEERT